MEADSHLKMAMKTTPPIEMWRLISRKRQNQEIIQPYLGGDEFTSSPVHKRYVINFGQMTLEQASVWPELLKIIEQKVKTIPRLSAAKMQQIAVEGRHGGNLERSCRT